MTRLAEGVRKLDDDEVQSKELSATTSASPGISSVQAEEWLERVVLDAEPLRRLAEVSAEYDDIVNSGDKTLHIPKTNKSLEVAGTGVAEAADRDFTEMDSLDAVEVEIRPEEDWYKGGIKISKETVQTTAVDVMETARHHLAEQIAQDLDVALRDKIIDETPVDNVVEPSSGELTPDAIAEAMEKIESNDWEPFALVINSAQKKHLRTDSQFTNAAEYGSDQVVLNGEIGQYLGVRVMVSNNIQDEAIMVGRNRQGEDVGPAVVWKEMPNVEMEYELEDATHRFYYDQAFRPAVVHDTALATIDTSE